MAGGGDETAVLDDTVEQSFPALSALTCSKVSDWPEKQGLSETDINEQFGEPSETEQFILGDGVPEFRVGLLDDFPMEGNEERVFREKIWKSHGCNVAIWFTQVDGELYSVDSLTWPDGLEF